MKAFDAGLLGEWKAEKYLKKQSMRILHRRFRTRHGEIDLIAQDQDETVLVEVKYRPKGVPGEGLSAINAEKKRHLRLAAAEYLKAHPAVRVRIDAVEISAAGIRHIKNIL